MTRLNDINIPNHFIKRLNMREQLIHKLEIIPIEVVIRNIATGSIVKRLGIEEGKVLLDNIRNKSIKTMNGYRFYKDMADNLSPREEKVPSSFAAQKRKDLQVETNLDIKILDLKIATARNRRID